MLKYPTVVIYHPTEENSIPFANIGYAGLIGTITGYSSSRIAISEKLRNKTDTVNTSRFGTPWQYVLRDVLQFGQNMSHSVSMLEKAHRTCSIWVGVGSGRD
jgi:hypothetical protein